MLPPLTDLAALLGIDLVLCAGLLRLLAWRRDLGQVRPWVKWVTAACFFLLWCPVGAARLPLLAYVRGISSDLSITLVALVGLGLWERLRGSRAIATREWMALNGVVAAAALFLYPLALGWGDWDAYRAGWGTWGLWSALFAVSLIFWLKGLRLLPMLVALALLAWTAGLLESTNLWDYLMDPWLAMAALFQCAQFGWLKLWASVRRTAAHTADMSR
ncbi:hypothetical protein [Polaromonas jejuensis]|uniref:Uncharacterized protein n=1 Tax=Polaromonas jejuensis TaxID=457502 RepID=A0ABW0QCR2_9BURK|nr:hypothetical protein [Polaromonas jejuensis]